MRITVQAARSHVTELGPVCSVRDGWCALARVGMGRHVPVLYASKSPEHSAVLIFDKEKRLSIPSDEPFIFSLSVKVQFEVALVL